MKESIPVYFFSCNSAKNIQIGYDNGMWAVPAGDSKWINARYTRSRSMTPDSLGLLYCSEKNNQHFTVPFRVKTQPKNVVVTAPWPEPWALPFEIEPLGPPSKTEPLNTVKRDWDILKNHAHPANELHLMGAAAFLPIQFTASDWSKVVRHLAFRTM